MLTTRAANIAEMMLCTRLWREDNNVQSMGSMMISLMGSRKGSQMQDFLNAISSTITDSLLKHVFLDFSLGPDCLIPHVCVAARKTVPI